MSDRSEKIKSSAIIAGRKTLNVAISAPALAIGGSVGGSLLTESVFGPLVGGVMGALIPSAVKQGREFLNRFRKDNNQ